MREIPEAFIEAAAPDPRQRELLRAIGLRSSMIVPLRARGRVIGDLALATSRSGRLYGEEDVAFAQELADRCALALDNARLYTELSTAGEEVNTILNGVADAVTAQAPDGRLVYANEAAVRIVGYGSVEAAHGRRAGGVRPPLRDDGRARRAARRREPARAARAGRRDARADAGAQPSARDGRVALVAHPGDAGLRRRGQRPARDQRDRGHHRAQARRARPALPRRGGPRARALAGLQRDAGVRGAPRGAGHRRLVRRRRLRRRRAAARRDDPRGPGEGRPRAGDRATATRRTRRARPGSTTCCAPTAARSTRRSPTRCSCRPRTTTSISRCCARSACTRRWSCRCRCAGRWSACSRS